VIWNINRQCCDLRLYEFGNCYFRTGHGSPVPSVADYTERKSLDIFITGKTGKESWNHKTSPTDFFHIKSATEMIFSRLGIDTLLFANGESKKKYFAESITYVLNNKVLAETGKLSKSMLSRFDIGQDVFYSHIDWDQVTRLIGRKAIEFTELPKYPSVRRDMAMLLDRGIKFGRIRDIAFLTEKNVLRDVSLFDVYESDSLGANKKSYAVSFILRDDLRTLTDKNIDKVMNNLRLAFENELGAKIR
ncbi:MAG: phenylalanine--tRNA ligase subunit beta, partial [Bacteroidales bacterium]|nr:phenylalanine--tRNA ligase subunit beta [Bacteroidales bacterium]